MNNVNIYNQEFEAIYNFILSCGFEKENITISENAESNKSLIMDCHSQLRLIMYYDREWTIEYYSGKFTTHNHVFSWNDNFIQNLFNGDIYISINSRFLHRVSAFSDINFIHKSKISKKLIKYKNKKKYKLFSTKEILINN
jgi:hypothetical protein